MTPESKQQSAPAGSPEPKPEPTSQENAPKKKTLKDAMQKAASGLHLLETGEDSPVDSSAPPKSTSTEPPAETTKEDEKENTEGPKPQHSYRVTTAEDRQAFAEAVARAYAEHPLGPMEPPDPSKDPFEWTLTDRYRDCYLALSILTPEELGQWKAAAKKENAAAEAARQTPTPSSASGPTSSESLDDDGTKRNVTRTDLEKDGAA